MMAMKRLAAASLAAMLVAAVPAPALAKTLVLDHFTLIDGTGKPPVANRAMIVEDGRIRWIGASAALRKPAGAAVEDLAGRFVLPGLIDAHVHLGQVNPDNATEQDFRKYYDRANVERQLHIYSAYGITAVQTMGTDDQRIFEVTRATRAGAPGMARAWAAGRGIVQKGSYGGAPGLDQAVATPAETRAMVDEEAKRGADYIKLWVDDEFGTIGERMSPPISTAGIAEAHKQGLKAIAHVFYYGNAEELTREGIDGFAHEVRDRPVDPALLSAMKAKQVWQVAATLSREASYTYDLLPFADDPFFARGVTPNTIAALKDPARRARLKANPLFAQRYPAALAQAMANFATEAKAGIRYGMGTDSGPQARFPGYFAHWELELMVKAGITPLQAITAATSANATWMRARDIGSLVPGKLADILVLDKDPLADIRNTRAIHAVFVGGEKVKTIWETCNGGTDPARCGPKPR